MEKHISFDLSLQMGKRCQCHTMEPSYKETKKKPPAANEQRERGLQYLATSGDI